jgi:protein involved in temperature-dependent protein secretion
VPTVHTATDRIPSWPKPSAAEQALKDGDPLAAIQLLQAQIRSKPADAKLRVFLFQLLCVQGDWARALNQLTVACELDVRTLPMVQAYRETIHCERLREQVFKGQKAPLAVRRARDLAGAADRGPAARRTRRHG